MCTHKDTLLCFWQQFLKPKGILEESLKWRPSDSKLISLLLKPSDSKLLFDHDFVPRKNVSCVSRMNTWLLFAFRASVPRVLPVTLRSFLSFVSRNSHNYIGSVRGSNTNRGNPTDIDIAFASLIGMRLKSATAPLELWVYTAVAKS